MVARVRVASLGMFLREALRLSEALGSICGELVK